EPATTTLTSSWPESVSSCSTPGAPGGSSNQLIPKASSPSSRRTNRTAPPGPAPSMSSMFLNEYPIRLSDSDPCEETSVVAQHVAPACVVPGPCLLGPLGEDLPATVLQVDAGPVVLGGKAHLQLGRLRRVVARIPGHDEAGRRLPGEDAAPFAFAAVVMAFEDPPADVLLEHNLGDPVAADRVHAERPPGPELPREHLERPLATACDHHGLVDRRDRSLRVAHVFLLSLSAAALKPARACSQKLSK